MADGDSHPGGDVRGRVILLEGRVEHLEHRVEGIERELGQGSGPSDRRAAPDPPAPSGPRCPGCHLEIASLTDERCEWCGFVLSVAR